MAPTRPDCSHKIKSFFNLNRIPDVDGEDLYRVTRKGRSLVNPHVFQLSSRQGAVDGAEGNRRSQCS